MIHKNSKDNKRKIQTYKQYIRLKKNMSAVCYLGLQQFFSVAAIAPTNFLSVMPQRCHCLHFKLYYVPLLVISYQAVTIMLVTVLSCSLNYSCHKSLQHCQDTLATSGPLVHITVVSSKISLCQKSHSKTTSK